MKLRLLCVAGGLALSIATGASAQDARDSARQKFVEATAAHARGDYREAAKLFEEAHRLAPAAGAEFNAGIAWDQAGELPRAADAYETALEMGGLTEDEAEQAQTRLTALKKVLGVIRVDQPIGATVTIAHLENVPVPARVHVKPGRYELKASMGARTTTTNVEVSAEQVQSIKLEGLEPAAGAAAASPPPSGPPTSAQPQPARSHDSRQDLRRRAASHTQRTWGFVALGAGAVLAGTAIFLGTRTLAARNEFNNSGLHDVDARDRAVSLRLWTNVAWGGAALGAGTGAVLLLTAPSVEF